MNGPTFAPPRPQAQPQPRPAMRSKPALKLDAEEGGGLRILTYLRLHWLMILFSGALLGGGLAYAAWTFLPSKFESYALLHVSSVPTQIANQNDPNRARTEFTTVLKTNATLMKSEYVLNAALRELRDVQTIRDQAEPIKYLEEEVLVSFTEGSEVIRITFKGNNPADTKKVVDAIQNAFISEVVMRDVEEKRLFLQKVQDAKLDLLRILEGRMAPSGKPGVIPASGTGAAGQGVVPATGAGEPLPPLVGLSPVVPNLPQGPTADDMLRKLDPRILIQELAALRRKVDDFPPQIKAAERRLASVFSHIEAVKKAPPHPLSLDAVEKDQVVAGLVMKAQASKRKYEMMAAVGDKNSPGVLRLHADWQADEAAIEKARKEKLVAIENARRSEEFKKLGAEGDAAQRDLQGLLDHQKHAQDQLAKAEKRISEIKAPEIAKISNEELGPDYKPSNTVMMTEDSVLSTLVKQYLLTQMELQSPPRVRPLQKASTPTQKDIKKQVIATIAAGFMGFALIALGVVAFETLTRKVSSLTDLKSSGPAPVVGVIPHVPSQAMGRDPGKRAAANEAIDRLRSYVSQTWLARGAGTVAVTSAIGEEGKGFTAFGLASSLAQSGYRTLLVDFDLRTPSLHNYAGVANGAGVCEVLRGEAEPLPIVQPLPNGLHLMTSGRWSDEARKAAVGAKLDALLAKLKEPYDCIVLHGHALLTAAESVEVARRCEAVLVCALYRETKTPLLRKATDRVAAMEIPYSGVVYVGASESEAQC